MSKQGGRELLDDPVAQRMLQAPFPCRLAYNWTDGSPRVIPIWFHWNGAEIVMASAPTAPKYKALKSGDRVAITIDSNDFPNDVLYLRGPIVIEHVDGIPPEYEAAAYRCLGQEGGEGFLQMVRGMITEMNRVKMTPDWVGVLDFQTRFPSAIEAAMGAG